MRAIVKICSIVISSVLFINNNSNAQFYKDMSVGLNGGIYVYQGDLTPERFGSLKTVQPGISLFAKKTINHFLAARVHMSFARLVGDESRYGNPEYRKQRNLKFSTPVKEFSAQLIWNVLSRNYEDRGIMPYVFSGAGISLLSVKKDFSQINPNVYHEGSREMIGLIADNAHGTPRSVLAVPVGIGAEYPVSDRFSVNVESSYRFIFTDYLDGYSKAASTKYQDHYHSTSVGFIYKFGIEYKGIACPTLKY